MGADRSGPEVKEGEARIVLPESGWPELLAGLFWCGGPVATALNRSLLSRWDH